MEAFAKVTRKSYYAYLELYAGRSAGTCDGTDCYLEGSDLRALNSKARFARYIFVVKNKAAAEALRNQIGQQVNDEKTAIITGNCNNKRTIRMILEAIPRTATSFAFINPPGYQKVHWSTIRQLASLGASWEGEKMELLIIFPLEMALFRNLMRPKCQASITRFYGNQRWEEIKRRKLAGRADTDELKRRLVELFKDGLKELGYRYVEDFKPASPSSMPYYHVISASDGGSRTAMLKSAWGKPRYLRCELLYGTNSKNK